MDNDDTTMDPQVKDESEMGEGSESTNMMGGAGSDMADDTDKVKPGEVAGVEDEEDDDEEEEADETADAHEEEVA